MRREIRGQMSEGRWGIPTEERVTRKLQRLSMLNTLLDAHEAFDPAKIISVSI
jgi:hypothetical protein